jgi:hypothetical protein
MASTATSPAAQDCHNSRASFRRFPVNARKLVRVMSGVPQIEVSDGRMRWGAVAPETALPDYDSEDEGLAFSADDPEPTSGPTQGRGRVLRFAIGIFLSALIVSGSALAWWRYSDSTPPPVSASPTGPISAEAQASGPISSAIPAPQAASNVEDSQKTTEILATLQADKEAIAKAAAQQAQQLSDQVIQLRDQIAGLQAEVAAARELQTSQQAELKRLTAAVAAQKAAQKKAQAARPRQPGDGALSTAGAKRQAEIGTPPPAALRPPPQPLTGAPVPLR